MNELQEKLRWTRRFYNISQREVALEVGVTTTTICGYEIGQPPNDRRARQLFIAIAKIAKRKAHQEAV